MRRYLQNFQKLSLSDMDVFVIHLNDQKYINRKIRVEKECRRENLKFSFFDAIVGKKSK